MNDNVISLLLNTPCNGEQARVFAAARNEIEKLRAALQYVIEDEPSGIPRASSACRSVVRKALGPNP